MAKVKTSDMSAEHIQEIMDNAYMGLGDTYDMQIVNPFRIDVPASETIDEFMRLCLDPKYLHFAAKHLLNMDLFPYQLSILDMLWNKKLPMLLAARGGAKTMMLAVYATLRALLDPGVKIVVAGAGLRQSGMVFEKMNDIWDGSPVLQDICGGSDLNKPRRGALGYEWTIGRSTIKGIPIGTGEKIRGLRANVIICDEFASIQPEVFEKVLRGFGSVRTQNTVEYVHQVAAKALMKDIGLTNVYDNIFEDVEEVEGGNQIILSGTSSYEFNHFYTYFCQYRDTIKNKGKLKGAEKEVKSWDEFAIIRIPYDQLPRGLMDETIIEQGAATMDDNIFKMEYGACFAKDSEGYFPASAIAASTCPLKFNDETISFFPEVSGDGREIYVMGIDPASERDNLAITICKVTQINGVDTAQHVYTWSANRKRYKLDKKKNPKHYKGITDYNTFIVRKIHELITRFNIQQINMDSGGGGISIIESLKDPKQLKTGECCVYDMDDEEVMGERGLHIIKLCQFSNRDWYEGSHARLLRKITRGEYLFPEYDMIAIERVSFEEQDCLMSDNADNIMSNIEQAKYQTTLIQETSSAKNQKKWDLPKAEGVLNERIAAALKKDHFTSVLLACDAVFDYLGEDIGAIESVGGIASREAVLRAPQDDDEDFGPVQYTMMGENKNAKLAAAIREQQNRYGPQGAKPRVSSPRGGQGTIAY
jgi:hypothetical protein